MNDLTPAQHRILARGLDAFGHAARRRRLRQGAVRTIAAAALAAACIVAVRSAIAPPASGLPAYVEIIRDDRQLAAELAHANACERFERAAGRLLVVECAAHDPSR
jgi:hypothetical protein